MEDRHCIESVLRGNTSAYSVLVDRYKDMVFTIGMRVLRNREEAEEVSQDTFVKAYQQLHTFKGNAKFSTWLYTIAYRMAIARTRKKKYETVDMDEYVHEEYSNESMAPQLKSIQTKEQKEAVKEALNRLPEIDSLIITLFYLEENSIQQVAEITGLSEANVKVRLHRARKKLQEELTEILNDEMEIISR